MRLSKKATSISAAVGAAALGVTLVALGSGVGAQFTDSATGSAGIDVGTFGCSLSAPADSGVNVSGDGHSASVTLPTIESSTASSETAPLTVTNSGSMPVTTTWSASIVSGNLTNNFSAVPVTDGILYGAGDSRTVAIGFKWSQLTNTDLGRSGTVKYTVSCNEAGFSLFGHDGGTATWDGSQVSLQIANGAPASQTAAGIHLTGVASGSSLPASEPTLVTDNFNPAGPRMNIKFSNGQYAFGYPAQLNAVNSWEVPGQNGYHPWSSVVSYVSDNSLTVTKVDVLVDGSGPIPLSTHVSCINYSGTPLFGSC